MNRKTIFFIFACTVIVILICSNLSYAYDEHFERERNKIINNPNLSNEEKKVMLDQLERSWNLSEQSDSSGGKSGKSTSGGSGKSDRPSENFFDSDLLNVIIIGLIIGFLAIIAKMLYNYIRKRRRAYKNYLDYSGKGQD